MAPPGRDQSGSPMGGSGQSKSDQSRSNLPAPYRSPWLALAADLGAVVADLGLRARELWRRNRQGALPLPRGWPQALAAGFWPLVLVGALALLGLGLVSGARLGRGSRPVPTNLTAPLQGAGAPPGVVSPARATPGAAPADAKAKGGPGAGPDPSPLLPGGGAGEQAGAPPGSAAPARPGEAGEAPDAAAPRPGPGSRSGSAAAGSPPASGPQALELLQASEPLQQDQPPLGPSGPDRHALASQALDSWLQRPEAASLLLAVSGDPELSRIQLRVSDAFGQLPQAEQQQRADLWLVWAQDWGYEQLELRSPAGALLGREARVGSGMIVGFSP